MNSPRVPLIDALKAIASQLIVLHHLAFYGPMSDFAHEVMPHSIEWLYDYGRVAVQVFLVVAGFLAAQGVCAAQEIRLRDGVARLGRRYIRLVPPYGVALLAAVGAAWLARMMMSDPSIPSAPDVVRILAHLLLLHDILGYEALSAGVWYVAIDFQLYVMLISIAISISMIGKKYFADLMMVCVAGLVAFSLFVFNRDSGLDHWGIYFFGSYGMGFLARRFVDFRRPVVLAGICVGICLVALALEFRIRIGVALMVAILLGMANRTGWGTCWPACGGLTRFFGKISYSVFLVHFPVCLLVNATFAVLFPGDPLFNLCGMAIAWGLSNLAGAAFFRYVEMPLSRMTFPVIR